MSATTTRRPTAAERRAARVREWAREQAALPAGAAVSVWLPVRTVNENNDHSHWRNRHRRSQAHHLAVIAALRGLPRLPLPVRVSFTRYSPGTKPMDSDGAVSAMKYVRDAIAKHYGVDDGGDAIEWAWPVKQERGAGHAVRVLIEAKGATAS